MSDTLRILKEFILLRIKCSLFVPFEQLWVLVKILGQRLRDTETLESRIIQTEYDIADKPFLSS